MKASTVLQIAVCIGSWVLGIVLVVYLYSLASRTDLFVRTAAVGSDVIMLTILTCVAAVGLSVLGLFSASVLRRLSQIALGLNCALTVCYLILLWIGKFGVVGLKVD